MNKLTSLTLAVLSFGHFIAYAASDSDSSLIIGNVFLAALFLSGRS